MSRFRRFASAIASGYAVILANIVYTGCSVPLALSYLRVEEFGLWMLVLQIIGFLALIEVGMSGSVYRFLIDYKDHQEDGQYRATLSTGVAVFSIQGALLVLIGWSLAPFLSRLMGVEPQFESIFVWLIRGQCLLTGFGLMVRSLTVPLQSHQRMDLQNYIQIGTLAISLGSLWLGFALGWGLPSLLFSSFCSSLFQAALSIATGFYLRILPKWRDWARPRWEVFVKLFRFGVSISLLTLGAQLFYASQIIVVSHTLGVAVAATWAICTKVFSLAQQFVLRMPDYATPALTEMYVRQESDLLRRRFRDLFTITLLVALVFGGVIALINSDFIQFWTGKSFAWSRINDPLMSLLLICVTASRCLTMCVGFDKRVGGYRYIYFAQGAGFVGAAWLLAPYFGFSGILVCALVADIIFCGLYGFGRTATFFAQPRRELLSWFWKPAKVGMVLAGILAVIFLVTESWSPLPRMLANGSLAIVAGGLTVWFLALDSAQRREYLGRLAARFGRPKPALETKD